MVIEDIKKNKADLDRRIPLAYSLYVEAKNSIEHRIEITGNKKGYGCSEGVWVTDSGNR